MKNADCVGSGAITPGQCDCASTGEPTGCTCTLDYHPQDCTCPAAEPTSNEINFDNTRCQYWKFYEALDDCSSEEVGEQCKCTLDFRPWGCYYDPTIESTPCNAGTLARPEPLGCYVDTCTTGFETWPCICSIEHHPQTCYCNAGEPEPFEMWKCMTTKYCSGEDGDNEELVKLGDCTCGAKGEHHPEGCACKSADDLPCVCSIDSEPEGCTYSGCIGFSTSSIPCNCGQYFHPQGCHIIGCTGEYDYEECLCQAGTAKFHPAGCQCTAEYYGGSCTCPTDLDLLAVVPVSKCICTVQDDPRRGITCPVVDECTDESRDPKCLCTSSQNTGACICTADLHAANQDCVCDQAPGSEYTLANCKANQICTGIDEPTGTCKCADAATSASNENTYSHEQCLFDRVPNCGSESAVAPGACKCIIGGNHPKGCLCASNTDTNCFCNNIEKNPDGCLGPCGSGEFEDEDGCLCGGSDTTCQAGRQPCVGTSTTPLGCYCPEVIGDGETKPTGCDNTKWCKELIKVDLAKVDTTTCACYLFGDDRGGCSNAACNTAKASQLLDIPIVLCGCLPIGDLREECVTETIACGEATADQLKHVSIDICPCYLAGDPRNGEQDECYQQTKECDAADAVLTGIPLEICDCQPKGDGRAGEICPAYCAGARTPLGCVCSTADVGTYTPAKCLEDKKCLEYEYPDDDDCDCPAGEDYSVACNAGVCAAFNTPTGCGCPPPTVTPGSNAGYTHEKCLLDLEYDDLSDCSSDEVGSGCKCTTDFEPIGCTYDPLREPKDCTAEGDFEHPRPFGCVPGACTGGTTDFPCICTKTNHPDKCTCAEDPEDQPGSNAVEFDRATCEATLVYQSLGDCSSEEVGEGCKCTSSHEPAGCTYDPLRVPVDCSNGDFEHPLPLGCDPATCTVATSETAEFPCLCSGETYSPTGCTCPVGLTGIPVDKCACTGDSDIRDECFCTGYDTPVGCKCSQGTDGDYPKATCEKDILCHDLTGKTAVECPCT
ncbi:MAG: hypothetical protein EZS28_004324, partial [Streblomastix strix]